MFDSGLFSAVTVVIMVTTFMTPPLLKLAFPQVLAAGPPLRPEGIEDLITEA